MRRVTITATTEGRCRNLLRHLEQPASSGLRHRCGARSGRTLPRRAGVSLCSSRNTTTLLMFLEEHQQQNATVSYGSTSGAFLNAPLRRGRSRIWPCSRARGVTQRGTRTVVYPGWVPRVPWYPGWYTYHTTPGPYIPTSPGPLQGPWGPSWPL